MNARTSPIVSVLAFLSVLLAIPSEVYAATGQLPSGYAVRDITAEANCSLTYRQHDGSPNGPITAESTVVCPVGSVIETTPVASEQEAVTAGAIYVPGSGDAFTDRANIDAARDRLRVSSVSANPFGPDSTQSCEFWTSAQHSYYATNAQVNIYDTIYYGQNQQCVEFITSATAYLSGVPAQPVHWSSARYETPRYPYSPSNSHECASLSTAVTADYYDPWGVTLGATYADEVIVGNICTTWNTSYAGYVVLY